MYLKGITTGIIMTLILSLFLSFSLCVVQAKTETARSKILDAPYICQNDTSWYALNSPLIETFPETGNSAQTNVEQTRIAEHKITQSELEELKSKTGVYVEEGNCNQLINGHGTGLRPPTDEEWTRIAENAYVVDNVTFQSPPSSIDQSATPWFPPIGNQDGEGSCTAWAVGYYVKTFQEAKEHAWNLSGAEWEGGYSGHPTQSYQDKIMSPDFIYHLINRGVDKGSAIEHAIEIVCSVGACSWEKMPYDPTDHSTWPSEEAWTEAPLYRGNCSNYYLYVDNSTGLANLKNWIASGNLAVIRVDADKYAGLTSADAWTLDNYVNPSTNHANTIVGYDDNVAYTENGELRYGAFKVANSWGIGGWEKVGDGFYWISYEAMIQRVEYCMVYSDLLDYKPELAVTFRISHENRYECNVTVGLGNPSAPIITKLFYPSLFYGQGIVPYSSNNVLFDITEFKDYVPTVYNQNFFLKVGDRGTSAVGTIYKFAVEYADSTDMPCQTIDGNYVYLNVTLPTLDTTWRDKVLVNSDQDRIDHKIAMATDNGGNMYLAYADNGELNVTAVYVRKSSDGGVTWPLVVSAWDSRNLGFPSIATDPYNNEIYVAFEREWTLTDHDIWVLRFVNATWSCIPVANTLGSDDRFPSVTCEYQYGSSNWQYVTYEYVSSNDDRDLMFGRSTDHGATWFVTKLHGDWPDGNVHAQPCITNAEGYLYIAYKWGADYDSACEIRVDRSTDYGETWTQFTDVDGLSNDCQFPSIVATHGGDTVIIGFQYEWSASDTDIFYSYSTDKGSTWNKGYALFASGLEDEKSPAFWVDGEGTQTTYVAGYIHAICKVGRYAEYRASNYSQLTDWSAPKVISDGWMGKGLTIIARPVNGTCCPYAAWTDSRTKDIFTAAEKSARTWTVDDDGPADFPSIQAAINVANSGDIIEVRNGIYYENLVISKSISLLGQNMTQTIIDGNVSGNVVYINASNVFVSNFTIRNSGTTFANNVGVYVDIPSSGVNVSGNIFSANGYGIRLNCSVNNIIDGNNLTNSLYSGIYIVGSSNNIVIRNNATNNGHGIALFMSSNNTLRDNHMASNQFNFDYVGNYLVTDDIDTSNTVDGKPIYCWINKVDQLIPPDAGYVALINCKRITVQDLSLTKNGNGLLLVNTSNSLILRNKITDCGFGLEVDSSTSNIFSENSLTANAYGMQLSGSSNNILSKNNLTSNFLGIYLASSSGNWFYHNNMNNTNQAQSFPTGFSNTWDNGFPSGGNYWSDYTGVDTNGDGIGDTPYVIDGNNTDHYPLMKPWEPITDLSSLVVRGSNNGIYYRTYNVTTASWAGWNALPGSTCDSPAATVIGNELHVVVRGSTGSTLYHGYVNLVGGGFSGWTLLSGSTPSAPILTSNGTHLCLVVRGGNNRIYYRLYNDGTHTWAGWSTLTSGSTGDSPAAALVGNELHLIVRGMSGSLLYYCHINLDSASLPTWILLSGTTPTAPTLASNSTHLSLVVRGSNNKIYYRFCNAATYAWGSWNALPTGSTGDRVAAAFTSDKLHFVVRGSTGGTLYQSNINLATSAFSGWILLSGTTPSSPTLTS